MHYVVEILQPESSLANDHVITDCIRRLEEDNVFKGVCLSTWRGGQGVPQYLIRGTFPTSGPMSFPGGSQSLVTGPFWGYPGLWSHILSKGYSSH